MKNIFIQFLQISIFNMAILLSSNAYSITSPQREFTAQEVSVDQIQGVVKQLGEASSNPEHFETLEQSLNNLNLKDINWEGVVSDFNKILKEITSSDGKFPVLNQNLQTLLTNQEGNEDPNQLMSYLLNPEAITALLSETKGKELKALKREINKISRMININSTSQINISSITNQYPYISELAFQITPPSPTGLGLMTTQAMAVISIGITIALVGTGFVIDKKLGLAIMGMASIPFLITVVLILKLIIDTKDYNRKSKK